ncbi:FAD-binding domain-containing protein [Jannaschia sp. CCS1]|uniref:FAD-binding domain-containing protein n=1 Tax=Jannaschia sp. (strain CCS1) TaxID=290400 RepID=UPI00006C0015|nr:FAD-binding domain-containing protein [Jannaschia sp. CCS1]ABD54790.1 deoxyribodipyrimidine photo-lyase family protein (cryptochrome) [Jannaschia sp. CCS1]
MKNVLVLFKRDLRVQDNPALALAASRDGAALPVFVAEPEAWAQPDASARQWRFVAESLEGLRADLAALGAPLIVRRGDMMAVLGGLCATHDVGEIISIEETGNLWSYGRDRRLAAWARGAGVIWTEVPQLGVQRRLVNRDGWARDRQAVMRQAQVPVPEGLRGVSEEPGSIPDARDLALAFDPCPGRQAGGRDGGLATLASFLTARGQEYRRAMSSPLDGAAACSRLSPHLAWGTLSSREVLHGMAARRAEVKGTRDGWLGSLRSFEARVAWRDHFMQKLEDQPAMEIRCLHSAYEDLRPNVPDATRLSAWEKGETGIPFVDACMRSLIATGWINFRMRAMLAAVASYHLWLDWRRTGPHLARMFTDYEPGIHWPQMQMQAGTTGMNTIRIYNPVKQGLDHDPTGTFTRTWCPELREVPDACLQTPWAWAETGSPAARRLGRRYPAPIVDVTQAARAARDRAFAVRRGDAFHREASEIVTKHASRKDSGAGRHFVNDRERTRRSKAQTPSAQLDLGL